MRVEPPADLLASATHVTVHSTVATLALTSGHLLPVAWPTGAIDEEEEDDDENCRCGGSAWVSGRRADAFQVHAAQRLHLVV